MELARGVTHSASCLTPSAASVLQLLDGVMRPVNFVSSLAIGSSKEETHLPPE